MMNNKELIEAGANIMINLSKVLHEAGGERLLQDLKNMTAYDFLISLSTNKIKFIYGEENGM